MENAESSLSLSEEIAQKVAQLEKSRDEWLSAHNAAAENRDYWRNTYRATCDALRNVQNELDILRSTGAVRAYREKIRELEAQLRSQQGRADYYVSRRNDLVKEVNEYKQALESARADLDRANRATKMAQARAKRWADASGNLYNRLRTCRHENVKLRERIRELEAKQRGIFGNGTPVEIVATPVNNIGQSRYVSGMGERGPIPQVHYGTDPTPPLANALEQVNAELRKANMKLSQDIPLDDDDELLYY